MSTGTTGGYETYQEKIAVINDNGEMKISNQGYIGKSTFSNVVGEDEYLKVKVLSKNMSYTTVGPPALPGGGEPYGAPGHPGLHPPPGSGAADRAAGEPHSILIWRSPDTAGGSLIVCIL